MKQKDKMKSLVGSIISAKDKETEKIETTAIEEQQQSQTAANIKSVENTVQATAPKTTTRHKTTDRLEASGERVIKTTYSIRKSTHQKIRLLSTLTGTNIPEIVDEALNQYFEQMVKENPKLGTILNLNVD
ncbi:MAG: hypothetical protein MJZ11_13020 [Lachnospiraceae bacterium]|nr:hypothetical protein [Lachnospiraceae bacterium]